MENQSPRATRRFIAVSLTTAGQASIKAATRDADGTVRALADHSSHHDATWSRDVCRLAIQHQAETIELETNIGGTLLPVLITETWGDLEREGETQGRRMPRIVTYIAKQRRQHRDHPPVP